MSQQDVDTLGRLIEAFNGSDLGRILDLADPDFEAVIPPELSAEPDTYRGHEGIRRYFESFHDAMEDVTFEAEQFWDAGDSDEVGRLLVGAAIRRAHPVPGALDREPRGGEHEQG